MVFVRCFLGGVRWDPSLIVEVVVAVVEDDGLRGSSRVWVDLEVSQRRDEEF